MSFNFWDVCKDCGKCCGEGFWFPVSNTEIEKIKNAGHTDFYEGNMLKTIDDHCIFLKEGKCSIQDIKPVTCKVYPVMKLFTKSKPIKPYYLLDLQCPAARKLPMEEIDKLIAKSKAFFESMSKEEYNQYKKEYMGAIKDSFDFE